MILYTKKYKPVEFEDKTIFNEGSCGDVYRYDNTILKVYKNSCVFYYKMFIKYFNILKSLNAPSLVPLHDYYFKHKISPIYSKTVYAYTMDYIEEEKINILTCDKQFIKMMLEKMEITIQLLSEKDLLIWDLKTRNFILNNQGLNFIDLDLYRKKGMGYKNSSYIINKNRMICLLNYYIFCELSKTTLTADWSYIKEDNNISFTENVLRYLTEDNFYNSIASSQQKVKKIN